MVRLSSAMLAVAALSLAPAVASPTAFHNHLVKASPAIDGEVTQAPTQLVLWFSEPPEVKLSSVKLRSEADTTQLITTGPVAAGPEPKSIAVPVTGRLAPGAYQVVYRTAGTDGHIVRGKYRFTLK
jgi:methionine-rich copper-binding protein CopC